MIVLGEFNHSFEELAYNPLSHDAGLHMVHIHHRCREHCRQRYLIRAKSQPLVNKTVWYIPIY